MNKFKVLLSIFFITINLPANAMENSSQTINDGRTVAIVSEGPWKVCTGFLYSEKIVLTAGHCLFNMNTKSLWPKLYVGMPGQEYTKNIKTIIVEKIIFPSNWSFKTDNELTDKNDFGILILSEAIPIIGKTIIANENQINEFIKNKTLISTVGYGRQGVDHDQNDNTFPKYAQFPIVSLLEVQQELDMATSIFGQKKYWGMQIHLLETPNGPSTCSGDSGSAFYIKINDDFIYLGPLSWGIGGMPACSGKGWQSNRMYIGSVAAYEYLDLIKQAENYVGSKQIENVPVSYDKITIKCYKGKIIKKVYGSNPKCPKGYKVRV